MNLEHDLGDDLSIIKTTRSAAGAGTWAIGRIGDFRFDALVFPEHAECADWEWHESRISKLWLQRRADRATVYSWDRGLDITAANDEVQAIADFLSSGLADLIYA